jgi:CheY-like chemotaxis protein
MKKIMLVDDNKDIRRSVQEILERDGYQVVLAKDGDECLQLVRKEKPDLILLDLLMPGIPAIKLIPKLKDIKIIIFSVVTLGEKNVVENGQMFPQKSDHSNLVGYINKPFDLKDLLAKIKKALN